jgi:hypothetical protein
MSVFACLGLMVSGPLGHAKAAGNYDNSRVADKALTYLDQRAIRACQDAGKQGGDQCRQFVNCILFLVGGQYPLAQDQDYQKGFSQAGGIEVSSVDAGRGDVIQYGNRISDADIGHLHTAIVVENKGNNQFTVVDANFRYDGMVRQHAYQPPSGSRFWRMGIANASAPLFTGTPEDGRVVESADGANLYVAAGGSLFWLDKDPNTRQVYNDQMQRKYGTRQPLRMSLSDIRAIEGSPSVSPRRTPVDNTFVHEPASATQYRVEYQRAFPVSNPNELAYLGGTGKAVMIPAGSIAMFAADPNHLPTIGNGRLLKALEIPNHYEVESGNLYHADNMTVIDCLSGGYKYKGTPNQSALKPVTASLVQNLLYYGHNANKIASCEMPSDTAFYGAGSAERWHIAGNNPYSKARYTDAMSAHCWLGNTVNAVQISQAAVNHPVQTENRACPDNAFLRNNQTGQTYQFNAGALHGIASVDMLLCLTDGHPEVVISIDQSAFGATPFGEDASCDFEGKLLQAPSGQTYWINNGSKHYVANQEILACISDHTDAGNPLLITDSTLNGFTETEPAYCPYPPEMRFVQGDGQDEVWRIFGDGTRQLATSLCQPKEDPRYAVHIVPAGEVDGHRYIGEFVATPEACAAIL